MCLLHFLAVDVFRDTYADLFLKAKGQAAAAEAALPGEDLKAERLVQVDGDVVETGLDDAGDVAALFDSRGH